ncbi:MAG: hypothetical protein Q9161_009561 [Pseudevernia consocians]
MGEFINFITHLTIALLYYSQVQAQTSGNANTPVEQISHFLIPKTFFSPTLTGGTGPTVTGQVSVAAGTSFFTWDCYGLTNFVPSSYCYAYSDEFGILDGYTFSVDPNGTSTYPYTVGRDTIPGYQGTVGVCPPEKSGSCYPQYSGSSGETYGAVFITAIITNSENPAAATASFAAAVTYVAADSSSAEQASSPTGRPSSGYSRPPSSGSLATSTKIGIGLGVPLGVIIVAIIAFLCMRHIRHKKQSRLRHSGNIAAAGVYPASDQDMKLNAVQVEKKTDVAASLEQTGPLPVSPLEQRAPVSPLGHEEDVSPSANIRELHGWDIPPYSRELEGSPAPVRKELP